MITLGLHSSDKSTSRPESGRNNIWSNYQDSDRCLVFVHGLGDDSRDCWYDEKSDSYWPDRIRGSAEFHDYSVFLGGYPTSKFSSGSYGISDCAAELFEYLRTGQRGLKPVLEHEAIFFVCHSLGGIVTRYMLVRQRDDFQKQSVGLALIASPSKGSKWADAVTSIAEFLGNEVLQTLQTESALLRNLDEQFKDLIHKKQVPHLFGREACETKGYKTGVGKIVSPESAGGYFTQVKKLTTTNHSSCVKPDSDTHPAHIFLLNCIKEFEVEFGGILPGRRPVQLICRRLHWSVLIGTEDGDAMNEQSFLGVTGAPDGKYDLPTAKQGSGHFSAPKRIAERTSPSVDLEPADPEGESYRLEFKNSPAPDNPVDVTFQLISFNAFSMDSRELQLKTGRTNGVDFVQKRIARVRIGELMIHVRLPDALRMQGLPYLEVRKIGEDAVEAAESGELAKFLDYSPLLRTVTLFVLKPVPERAYRICWRLAPPLEPAPEPTDKELDRNQALVARLLWLRGCAEQVARSKAQVEALEQLNKVLGDCAGLASQAVGQSVPSGQLEVSLMVADDSDPGRASVLRMVAGSDLVKGYWNLVLPAGDGNGGRAFKKSGVRIFDAQKVDKDPFKNVYKPIPGSPRHQWLMSVPLFSSPRLIFGVLNVGTFQKAQVRTLRKLEENKTFADELQGIVLKGLDLLKSE